MNEIDFKNNYLSNFETFENSLNGEKSKALHTFRKKALKSFSELPFPTLKDEEWKYTNIAPLLNHNFKPASFKEEPDKIDLTKFLFDELEHSLLVFINGKHVPALSVLKDLPKGVIAGSISESLRSKNPVLQKHLGRYAEINNIFTALSSAFIQDGAFVYIPDGKIIEDPIHVLFLTTADNEEISVHPRNLFYAGKNSQGTIIEHYSSLSEDVYFTNSVTEIIVDENAVLDHLRFQQESKKAFHISRIEIDQERNSNFSSHLVSSGAEFCRNDFNSRFNAEGGECTLNGLFMIDQSQLFDAHTLIDHAKPHCSSHEHYKGILNDNSRGVFNGKVIVRKDAQKTNAFQENNNIILSNNALVNTKPQLEIFADDVKCSHGATIGQLDNEAKFYLKSRGIGEEAANSILIHAFASDVIKSIKIEAVRNYLEKIISEKYN